MLNDSSMVSSEWLQENIRQPKLIVLYTQMDNPMTGKSDRSPNGYIPGSVMFDFENAFCCKESSLPHTMLSEGQFTRGAQSLGINRDSLIVIYDNQGIYCAPRVWWMFKSMGHNNVYVLNGGLPAWLKQGFPIQQGLSSSDKVGNFQGSFKPDYFISADEIWHKLEDIQLLDARSAERFNGTQAEPRPGLRSGHVPTAINLPFTECLTATRLKPVDELRQIFMHKLLTSDRPMVFSCGSGVTACILALAASEAGYSNIMVYDGSWSEWGGRSDLPVET